MNTSKPLYLFFDYDNTVRVNDAVSQKTVDAMEYARALGHRLILCTGRARGSKISDFSTLPWDGAIYGGADILYHGKLCEEHVADLEDILIWTAYSMRTHRFFILEGQNEIVRYRFDKKLGAFTKQEIKEQCAEICDIIKGNPITKISILGTDFATAELPKTQMNPIVHPSYLEVFGNGRDKGVAIRRFCELFDVDLAQCACFGDSMNDYPMFAVCPIGIAMKWAPEELAKTATYQAQSDEGVAEGIAWLLGQKE